MIVTDNLSEMDFWTEARQKCSPQMRFFREFSKFSLAKSTNQLCCAQEKLLLTTDSENYQSKLSKDIYVSREKRIAHIEMAIIDVNFSVLYTR